VRRVSVDGPDEPVAACAREPHHDRGALAGAARASIGWRREFAMLSDAGIETTMVTIDPSGSGGRYFSFAGSTTLVDASPSSVLLR
jgi:hypothetical protein